jgi:peptidoglycan/LPS O-acetylase OafA/YrhL
MRLKSIDVLRGAAALAVVLRHAAMNTDTPPLGAPWFNALYWFFLQGLLGVPLFFVLSGYCIHMRWAKQKAATGEEELPFIPFWKRRIYRLYPPYLVMLCLTMILVLIAYVRGMNVPIVSLYPEPKLHWIGMDFLAHVTMLHGLHPVFDMAGGNPVYWTLAREEYFYLMYFPLLWARRRWGLWPSVFGVLALGFVFPYLMRLFVPLGSSWWQVITLSAVVLWFQWVLGMVAVEAYYGLVKLPKWCSSAAIALVFAVLAWVGEKYFRELVPTLRGLTFFVLTNWVVGLEKVGAWREGKLTQWLAHVGLFSYSLYLIHNPVRMVMKFFLGPISATQSIPLYLLVVAATCVAGYYAAKVYFWVVERHFLTHREAKPTRLAAVGADTR